MIDKLSVQSRVIIASVISFMFFIFYDSFVAPHIVQPQKTEANQTSAINTKSSPAEQGTLAIQSDIVEPSSNIPLTAKQSKTIVKVISVNTELAIDSLGRISQVTLKKAEFLDENHDGLPLLDVAAVKPLEIRFADEKLNRLAFNTPYISDKSLIDTSSKENKLTLTQDLGEIKVTKELTFYPDGHYDIRVSLSKPAEYFITQGLRPAVEVDMMAVHGLLIKEFDNTIEIIEDGDATGFESFRDAKVVSSFDKYYASVFYNNSFDVLVNKVEEDNPLGFVKGKQDFQFSGYIGPKLVKVLNSIHEDLGSIVEYGVFTFIAAPMFVFLDYLFSFTGSWAWSIILLTIIVRLVLFPLSAKGMVSMHKLKTLGPKIKEIQKKYKDDKQKIQAHTMDLYKKHGANPLGGCLPFILQIPVFFAIYRVLLNAIEIKGATWLYINDLSLMDPYYVMPVFMGISMYFQQRITPSNFTDPMQEKIFKFLPLVFTFFFLTFPAGLVLYWFVNNLLSILQQYIINKKLEIVKAESHDKN